MRLQGKIAIVTGAGKGIGREIALGLAGQGALVILTARTKSDLEQVAAEIEKNGGQGVAIAKDLTDAVQVQELADEVVERFGAIDILVNNAGGYPKEIYDIDEHQPIKIWDWKEEQWDQIIRTNLKIPFLCTNKILPVMIKQKKGDIVNISSRMGRIASQMGAYAVAKAGIITLTKTSAIQAIEYGVKVNAVSPGMLDTPGQRDYNKSVGQDGAVMGNASDVSKAVIYLVCDAPANMTGQSMDLFTTL